MVVFLCLCVVVAVVVVVRPSRCVIPDLTSFFFFFGLLRGWSCGLFYLLCLSLQRAPVVSVSYVVRSEGSCVASVVIIRKRIDVFVRVFTV